MSKFAIGDKVRLTDQLAYGSPLIETGMVGTVTAIDTDSTNVRLTTRRNDEREYGFYDYELELVTPEPFTWSPEVYTVVPNPDAGYTGGDPVVVTDANGRRVTYNRGIVDSRYISYLSDFDRAAIAYYDAHPEGSTS